MSMHLFDCGLELTLSFRFRKKVISPPVSALTRFEPLLTALTHLYPPILPNTYLTAQRVG